MEVHQAKKLLHSKGNTQQAKKHPTGWDIVLATYATELISRRYRELKKLNIQTVLLRKGWYTNGNRYLNIISIISHQENANKNHCEVSHHHHLQWLSSKNKNEVIIKSGKDVRK